MRKRFGFAILAFIVAAAMMLSVVPAFADQAMPDWYPDSWNGFEFFCDPYSPRLEDTADILSAEDEAEIASYAAEVSEEIGKDIVIKTDVSSYGLGHMEYADDYFDARGYGAGEDREGICLFIDMDPDNRGWWVSCNGPDMMALYTEESANALDDQLYMYMAAGEYAAGIYDWVCNIRTLCVTGIPFAPDWFPEQSESFVHGSAANSVRVVDSCGVLSEAELADFEERAEALAENGSCDVAVNITDWSYGWTLHEYAANYYYYNNCGKGPDFDGILLVCCADGSYVIYPNGSAAVLSARSLDRIETHCGDAGSVSDMIDSYLRDLNRLQKSGRIFPSGSEVGGMACWSVLIGLVVSVLRLAAAKKTMKVPSEGIAASNYLVPGGLGIVNLADEFLYMSQVRMYNPPKEESSGSGGHSSFSGGHISSSGGTHSGSGRSF